MSMKRIEAKIELLRKIREVVEEAEAAGIRDPAALIRRILDASLKFRVWKETGKR